MKPPTGNNKYFGAVEDTRDQDSDFDDDDSDNEVEPVNRTTHVSQSSMSAMQKAHTVKGRVGTGYSLRHNKPPIKSRSQYPGMHSSQSARDTIPVDDGAPQSRKRSKL